MHEKRMVAVRSAIFMVRGAGVASAWTPPKSLGRDGFFGIFCRFLVRFHSIGVVIEVLLDAGNFNASSLVVYFLSKKSINFFLCSTK
jgi:hypothetical protein